MSLYSEVTEWLLILNHWSFCFSDIIFLWASSSIESATLFHLLFSSRSLTTISQFDSHLIWHFLDLMASVYWRSSNRNLVLSQIFFNCLIYLSIKIFPLSSAAAAAAKSLQSCPTLCDPIDSSPPGSSVPGILQARILEWVAISFSDACMHAKSLQSCLTVWSYGQ